MAPLVTIHEPPPSRSISPKLFSSLANSQIVRMFDPTDYHATATGFRTHGPHKRFDHQRTSGKPVDDLGRGIYYAALTFEGALVEVFGDNGTGFIETGEWHVASPRVTRDLRLLDLRGKGLDNGAWRAGSVEALCKNADYRHSQAWSRYFYENPYLYTAVDGLIYGNAHNDDDAIALYERTEAALDCPPDAVIRLDDPVIRTRLLEVAHQLEFTVLSPRYE